jgi:hypothetical protein
MQENIRTTKKPFVAGDWDDMTKKLGSSASGRDIIDLANNVTQPWRNQLY